MTTTAHEDQFTDAPEPVRQPYDTGSILRRNVADLEIALRKQTKRAEKAEAELAKLREQEREWCAQLCEWLPVGTGYEGKTFAEAIRGNGLGGKLADGFIPSTFRITEPVPAPAVPDGFVLIPKKISGDAIRKFTRAYNHGNSDFGAGWFALLEYLQSAPAAPAVPAVPAGLDDLLYGCLIDDDHRYNERAAAYNDGVQAAIEVVEEAMQSAHVPVPSVPVPSVPEEWREAMQEAYDTFQRYADLHQAKGTHDGYKKAKANQKLANKLYALLQSAEVTK